LCLSQQARSFTLINMLALVSLVLFVAWYVAMLTWWRYLMQAIVADPKAPRLVKCIPFLMFVLIPPPLMWWPIIPLRYFCSGVGFLYTMRLITPIFLLTSAEQEKLANGPLLEFVGYFHTYRNSWRASPEMVNPPKTRALLLLAYIGGLVIVQKLIEALDTPDLESNFLQGCAFGYLHGWVTFLLMSLTTEGHFLVYWYIYGIHVLPFFNGPWEMTSLRNFWSVRCHQLLRDTFKSVAFYPLQRLNKYVPVLAVFVLIAVFHDYMFWVAFGLTTCRHFLFFSLQGVLCLLENIFITNFGNKVHMPKAVKILYCHVALFLTSYLFASPYITTRLYKL